MKVLKFSGLILQLRVLASLISLAIGSGIDSGPALSLTQTGTALLEGNNEKIVKYNSAVAADDMLERSEPNVVSLQSNDALLQRAPTLPKPGLLQAILPSPPTNIAAAMDASHEARFILLDPQGGKQSIERVCSVFFSTRN